MKTTIELAKECGMEKLYSTIITNDETLEAFRLAVEADYKSRCECVAYVDKNSSGQISMKSYHGYSFDMGKFVNQNLYTLPKETK